MRGRTYAFHGRRTLAVGAYPWMLVGMTVIRVLAAACLRVSTFVSTCLARDNRTGSPLARSARETRPIFSASPMAGSFPSSASRRSTCAGVIVSGTSRAATTAGGAPLHSPVPSRGAIALARARWPVVGDPWRGRRGGSRGLSDLLGFFSSLSRNTLLCTIKKACHVVWFLEVIGIISHRLKNSPLPARSNPPRRHRTRVARPTVYGTSKPSPQAGRHCLRQKRSHKTSQRSSCARH